MKRMAKQTPILLTALLLLASCSATSEVVRAAPSQPMADHPQVLSSFGSHAMAANQNWLLGVVKQPNDAEQPTRVSLVNLQSNEVKNLDGPVDGTTPITIDALVASADGFVGVGNRCDSQFIDEGCWGQQIFLRFDPTSEDWNLESMPVDRLLALDFFAKSAQDFVLVESGKGKVHVSRVDASGHLTDLATLEEARRPRACVTSDALWLFFKNSKPTTDVESTDTTYSLIKIALNSGEPEEVPLPKLAGYFGGVTTKFGCNVENPLVVTTPPGTVPAAATKPSDMKDALTGLKVYERTQNTWQTVTVDAVKGNTVPDSILSGQNALLLAAEIQDETQNRPIAVVLDGNQGSEVPRDGSDAYLWQEGTGNLIRLFSVENDRRFQVIDVAS